ncbi:DUF4192 domain-containing protein [Rhodococcus sp. BP-252]|uniref:DUF4192 family protein n=1 Tax=unclassified Rhodococcus (in: high G+C Gram-positive bacteria) TaxID=192944 RepID=UPI001C9B6611|nr:MULTISPECIES: DUF4192 family protein [unclassified Rhodococcus (in: high G+C Gram-positive bacteria)]MBY6412884.1 DUF4192 domain-containing protein [Rhodococcus sp. BP-320]MBY6417579.1 DUF4192 domain-containing protein [Rhodococcus sp. BP-321]MBY6423049.1 DUF4192 domain-containing protein [Rhodococcus sp. BP-324]MBY6427603.1 DUF4192 domain-containing protein [Rhodococcus sp. BP-323]MBY6432767.1 DUF4192 domain-containing protein [Rhodococcus sp. BP-322]
MTNHNGPATRLTSTAAVLAAIPAMLGFTPENSIVTIFLGDADASTTSVRAIVRSNVADGVGPATDVADAARVNDVAAAIVIAVADPGQSGEALTALAALRAALADAGVSAERSLHTYGLSTGAAFIDLDTGAVGGFPDPATTELSALTVFEGRRIESSRSVIEQRFAERAEVPESVGLEVAARLGELFLPQTFEELAAVIYAREVPSDELAARVGLTLSGRGLDVRDSYLRLAVYGEDHAVEAMTHIAGALRGTARAQALTIAAFFAYLANHGPAAGIAIDAARAAAASADVETPSFAVLIDRALRVGMEPEQLRALIPNADFVRERTGANLPG